MLPTKSPNNQERIIQDLL